MYARMLSLGIIFLLYYMNTEKVELEDINPTKSFDKDYNIEEFDDVFEIEDKESGMTYILYKKCNTEVVCPCKKAKLSIEGKVHQQ